MNSSWNQATPNFVIVDVGDPMKDPAKDLKRGKRNT